MSTEVGWGIVGTGGIATRMASALQEAEGATLVAVSGRTPERAGELGERFGVEAHSEYAALLGDPRVELVYVATPTHLHAEHALAAIEAGKHVLVEKPMALSASDARAMADAAAGAGVRLGVGFHLRCHPVHRKMRELVVAGELGDVVLAQALWGFYSADWSRDSWKMDPERAGAGSLAGLGVHLLDLVPWLVGREVVEVSAMADGPNEDIPVEFLTVALLRLAGGEIGEVISSRRLHGTDDDVTVYGERGRLRGRGTATTEAAGSLEVRTDGAEEVRELPLRDLYALEAEACSGAVREGCDFPASAEDGVRSVELTLAVLESARAGSSVRLGERHPTG
ncbi:MAG: Gfo/Idh/MocA family oxidoreductase [Gaiella sp.]|nr:Gfo/Idh/MocA family oxidoreductase [Gaiella sp.]